MFAPKVARPQTKTTASPQSCLASLSSTLRPQRTSNLTWNNRGDHQRNASLGGTPARDDASRGPSWDFARIALFLPDRGNPYRSSQLLAAKPLLGAVEAPALAHTDGMPLNAGVRAHYEPRLGKSLADVRIHTDAQAAASADSLHAEAYTFGRDIVFGTNRYSPGTPAGERLLAHELAHVGQQYFSAPTTTLQSMSRPGDDAERAADRAAELLLAGRTAYLSPLPCAIQRQAIGDTGPGAEPVVLIQQWLEQHQFAPPEEQPRDGEHVLLNGEDMPLTRAVQLTASATRQTEELVRSVLVGALGSRMPRSLTGATFVGPGNNVPGLPLMPRTWEDRVALGKASDLNAVDSWLDDHGFRPPEVRDPVGDQVLLDGEPTTMERAADRAFAALGQYPYVRRQEVLVHLRQKYVEQRGGSTTQVVFGYTLVPRALQATSSAPDPLNPLRTQHQFSFTITRAHHPNDSPGLETSFQGSVALNDSGDIVNLQGGGQEAIVAPLLRGWIQVSGLVQVMAAANWSRTASGSVTVGPSVQAAAGAQVLITPAFRGGPLTFLNGHIQLGPQILGTVTAQPDQTTGRWGGSVGVAGGFVVNVPF